MKDFLYLAFCQNSEHVDVFGFSDDFEKTHTCWKASQVILLLGVSFKLDLSI